MIRRLLADADLKSAIVSGVLRCNSEIDFKRSSEVPLAGLKDPQVLALAARETRVLVSHDVSTMPKHMRDIAADITSPGLILIPQDLPVADAIENLLLICEALEPRELQDHVCLIPSLVMYGF